MPYYSQPTSSVELAERYRIFTTNLVPTLLRRALFAGTYLQSRLLAAPFDDDSKYRWRDCHEIKPKLYLGRLPDLKQLNDLLKLFPKNNDSKDRGLIVSCNDFFELAGRSAVLAKVVDIDAWETLGLRHHVLIMRDFTDRADDGFIVDTLNLMRAYHDAGKPIYVHCKAGHSRSVMIVLLHLLQIDDSFMLMNADNQIDAEKTYERVELYLKNCRSEISLRDKKSKAIHVIRTYLNPGERPVTELVKAPEPESITSFLQSESFFAALSQSIPFKGLMLYLAKECSEDASRIQTIGRFFSDVFSGRVNDWYPELERAVGSTSPTKQGLAQFVHARPLKERFLQSYSNQNEVRRQILTALKREIDTMVYKQFQFQPKPCHWPSDDVKKEHSFD